MEPLLTAAQMKKADAEATQAFGLPELLLMEHAALALVGALERRFGAGLPRTRGAVLAGNGNNGGDVLAAARLLLERGCPNLFVVLVGGDQALSESTRKQLEVLGRLGIAWGRELAPELLGACDWILDGMLGTGLSRPVSGEFQERIEALNTVAGRKWIVSADIPSGLSADTGHPNPVAVRASATVTFGFYKRGLVTAEAAHYVGELSLAPVQIPRTVSSEGWSSFLYLESDASRLPSRRKDSHKGDFGRVAIVAGPPNREGAAALSALGALKAGAGLVTVYASADTLASLRPRLAAEVMSEVLGEALYKTSPDTAIAVGPGLGTDEKGAAVLRACLERRGPLVIDADGTTLIAADPKNFLPLLAARSDSPTVLTPHPKEAARLLRALETERVGREQIRGGKTEADRAQIGGGETEADRAQTGGGKAEAGPMQADTDESAWVARIQADRFTSVRLLADAYHCGVILKGSGSLFAAPESPVVAVRAGDSGLSKGGTGDVLSGILASWLAQGLTLAQAAPLAIYVHGRASELLTRRHGHPRSSLAGEVAHWIPEVLKELECRARE